MKRTGRRSHQSTEEDRLGPLPGWMGMVEARTFRRGGRAVEIGPRASRTLICRGKNTAACMVLGFPGSTSFFQKKPRGLGSCLVFARGVGSEDCLVDGHRLVRKSAVCGWVRGCFVDVRVGWSVGAARTVSGGRARVRGVPERLWTPLL